jgi:hypothetical protein
MLSDQKIITTYIKRQIEAFIVEMDDFYPFGAAVTNDGELKPLAAYLDDDETSVEALLPILENHIQTHIGNYKYRLCAIALSVLIKENGSSFDAVQIRFYQNSKETAQVNYKYLKGEKKAIVWL